MSRSLLTSEKIEAILTSLRIGWGYLLGDQFEAAYRSGSQARWNARPASDIYVLSIPEGDFDYGAVLGRTLDLTAGLSLEFNVVISRSFVPRERIDHEMSPFLMDVRREALPA